MKKISSSEIIIGCVAGGITFLLFGLICSIFSKGIAIFLYIVATLFFLVAIAKKIDTRNEKPSIDDAEQGTVFVYITETGSKYHYDKNCAGKYARMVPLSFARSKRLQPCKKCK